MDNDTLFLIVIIVILCLAIMQYTRGALILSAIGLGYYLATTPDSVSKINNSFNRLTHKIIKNGPNRTTANESNSASSADSEKIATNSANESNESSSAIWVDSTGLEQPAKPSIEIASDKLLDAKTDSFYVDNPYSYTDFKPIDKTDGDERLANKTVATNQHAKDSLTIRSRSFVTDTWKQYYDQELHDHYNRIWFENSENYATDVF